MASSSHTQFLESGQGMPLSEMIENEIWIHCRWARQGQDLPEKHEVSKGLLAKIKFRGGQILVNGRPENAIYLLDIGDRLVIDIPAEEGFETLKPMDRPLDILFEDDHFWS